MAVEAVEHRHQVVLQVVAERVSRMVAAICTQSQAMPPTTTIASGRCVCEPIFMENAAGNNPKSAVMAGIITGRTRLAAPSM